MTNKREQFSLILLVLLVLVGCGEESVDEFVGKWYAKGINGKSIDDYFKGECIHIDRYVV